VYEVSRFNVEGSLNILICHISRPIRAVVTTAFLPDDCLLKLDIKYPCNCNSKFQDIKY